MKVFNKFLFMEDMRKVYGQANHKAFCRTLMREPGHWANVYHGATKQAMEADGLLCEEEWFGEPSYAGIKAGGSYEKA